MDDTVNTPDDLEERVGIPVLGFVPDMQPQDIEKDGFAYRGTITLSEPKSSAAEAYRSIRTNLSFCAPPEEAKVLVVTSAGPGDGKTTTTTNLALVLAHGGMRVLLVDADFRRPMIHNAFGLESKAGLSNLLVGQTTLDRVLQKAQRDGKVVETLDVLAAGPKPPNPTELLDSRGMRKFLEEARKTYDRVILDSPPVLFVADASIVAGASDGVILVVKAAKNTRSIARKARKHLEGVKAKILGGILNDVYVSRLGYYYSYYYHYYPYARYYRDYYKAYYPEESKETEQKSDGSKET
jgi:capsular exopolysaccharide synthesis family protein